MIAVGRLHRWRIHAPLLEMWARRLWLYVLWRELTLHRPWTIVLLIIQHLYTRISLGRNTEALCSRSQKMFKIATLGRKVWIGEDTGGVWDNRGFGSNGECIRKIRAIVVRGGIFAVKGSFLMSTSTRAFPATSKTTATVSASRRFASFSCGFTGRRKRWMVVVYMLRCHIISVWLSLHSGHHV